mgnify:CR=1 FL=1
MDKDEFLALWAAWYELDRAALHIETASLTNIGERVERLETARQGCWVHMLKLHTSLARQGVIDAKNPRSQPLITSGRNDGTG